MVHSLFIVILLIFRSHLSMARDTLLPGHSLSQNQILVSKNGVYELRVHACSFEIWFADTPDELSWVNYNPIFSVKGPHGPPCKLSISSTGNLVLTQSHSLIWSSNITWREQFRVSTVLVLLDSGNLVLQDTKNSSRIVWQSFDHPTDIWLPGAPLGFNKVTGKNISLTIDWGIYEKFTIFDIDPNNPYRFIIHQGTYMPYFCGMFPNWMHIQKINGTNLVTFDDTKQPNLFLQLSGWQIIIFHWVGDVNNSKVLWYAPESLCDLNSFCGPNSLCSTHGFMCSCPSGFEPAAPNDWGSRNYNLGCSRLVPLHCEIATNSSHTDEFYLIDIINKYPDDPESLFAESETDCATACSNNCFCSAYSYSHNCNLWFGDLTNTIVRDDGYQGYKINFRVRTPILEHRVKNRVKNHWMVIMLVIGAVTFVGFVLMLSVKHMTCFTVNKPNEENFLKVYSYAELKTITKGFSHKLGEGGFGSVFKGSLPNSSIVAVKRMKTSFCEEKHFRAEVQTIGIIQHTNLVRLLGFCSKGSKRMLVYEYMPKGSLDSHLFSESRDSLSWNLRYHVMIGVARGLAYLHEECINCIIHCDIKPENVLLNEEFSPKIADFGMAKLLVRDFSRALTTTRGTIGYLAPEWLSGQPITQKADVYSFGMMLFEIISGRRNIDKIKNQECTYFPLYAAIKLNQGEISCLLDNRLQENVNMEELNITCKVACWCIQEREIDRPSMREVVQMLEGATEVSMPQVPGFLQRIVDIENDSTYSIQD